MVSTPLPWETLPGAKAAGSVSSEGGSLSLAFAHALTSPKGQEHGEQPSWSIKPCFCLVFLEPMAGLPKCVMRLATEMAVSVPGAVCSA